MSDSQAEHEGSIPFTCSKTKGTTKVVPFVLGPPPSGRLHPPVIQMLGVGKAAPAQFSAASGGSEFTAQKAPPARRPVREILSKCCRKSKISILTVPSTSSRTTYRSRRRFLFQSKRRRSFTPSLLLSKPQPLCWVAVWVPPCGRLLSQSSSTSFLPTQDKTRGATKVVPLVLGSVRPEVGAGFWAAQNLGCHGRPRRCKIEGRAQAERGRAERSERAMEKTARRATAIQIRGARVHNLKNVDVDVPLNRNRRGGGGVRLGEILPDPGDPVRGGVPGAIWRPCPPIPAAG